MFLSPKNVFLLKNTNLSLFIPALVRAPIKLIILNIDEWLKNITTSKTRSITSS